MSLPITANSRAKSAQFRPLPRAGPVQTRRAKLTACFDGFFGLSPVHGANAEASFGQLELRCASPICCQRAAPGRGVAPNPR
jgi:hypothetical protein